MLAQDCSRRLTSFALETSLSLLWILEARWLLQSLVLEQLV
jgi:hypothetical protein